MATVEYTENEKQYANNKYGFTVNAELEKRLRAEGDKVVKNNKELAQSWYDEADDAKRIKEGYAKKTSESRSKLNDPISVRRALDLADNYNKSLDREVDKLFEDAEANVRSKHPEAFQARGTSIIVGTSPGSSPSTRYENPEDSHQRRGREENPNGRKRNEKGEFKPRIAMFEAFYFLEILEDSLGTLASQLIAHPGRYQSPQRTHIIP